MEVADLWSDENTPRTKSFQVLNRLYQAIVEGYLRPGQVINVSHLAQHLQVSRTPVREALQILAQEGLVEPRGQRGLQVVNITEGLVDQLFSVRTPLEILAVQLACDNIEDEAQLDQAYDCIEQASTAWGQGYIPGLVQANTEFHHILVQLSQNQYLITAMKRLLLHASLVMMASLTVNLRPNKTIQEHKHVLEALTNKDHETASDLIRDHMLQAKESALTHLRSNPLLEGIP